VSVSLTLVLLMALMYASGVYLMLGRSMTRMLLGFLLVGNATNLLIIIVAGRPGAAPIVGDGLSPEDMHDPLPEALILTAIVITFGVSAFLLALIYRSWRLARADVVQNDEEDIAVGGGIRVVETEDMDASDEDSTDDTEFGTLAEAAVQNARDLHEADTILPDRAPHPPANQQKNDSSTNDPEQQR
jgi:multicomponent Na+:H+ antiporter subunit C